MLYTHLPRNTSLIRRTRGRSEQSRGLSDIGEYWIEIYTNLSPTRCDLQAACHRITHVLQALPVFSLSSARAIAVRFQFSILTEPRTFRQRYRSLVSCLADCTRSLFVADCTTLIVAQPRGAQVAAPSKFGASA